MKIGIISMQRVENNGSFLQAYGLKMMLEQMGHEVCFVDYKVEAGIQDKGSIKATVIYRKVKAWKKYVEDKKIIVDLKKSKKKNALAFQLFLQDYRNKYLKELGISTKRRYRIPVDILIIGSDEVFNVLQDNINVGFSRELFGVNSNAKKVITYAASFGNTTIDKLESYKVKDTIKEWLSNIDVFSVRDRNTAQIVQQLTGKTCEMNLDPVLISDYTNVVNGQINLENYIIVYSYPGRMTSEEADAIKAFAVKKNKKLICFNGVQYFCDEFINCTPLEVINYFQKADYVITDTFHGTILSVITHRKFATLIRKSTEIGYGNEEKLGYLLEKLELEERCLHRVSDLEKIVEQKIDYERVDQIRNAEKERTINYLKSNLK